MQFMQNFLQGLTNYGQYDIINEHGICSYDHIYGTCSGANVVTYQEKSKELALFVSNRCNVFLRWIYFIGCAI